MGTHLKTSRRYWMMRWKDVWTCYLPEPGKNYGGEGGGGGGDPVMRGLEKWLVQKKEVS